VPELDGLRAFAILAVMLFHARAIAVPVTGADEVLYRITEAGWVGVDLFFVLSGFLITGILLDTKEHDGYFKSFFARRALRILPLYYAVLAATFVALHLGLAGSHDAQPFYVLYLQNWLRIDDDHYRIKLLAHFWSLAIEEQFYLFWPLLVWLLPRRRIPWLCGGVIVASFALRLALAEGGVVPAKVTYYLTITRLDGLALGGLIAVLARSARGLAVLRAAWRPVLAAASIAIAVLAIATGHFIHEDVWIAYAGYLAIALWFGSWVVASLTLAPDGRLRRLLRQRHLAWIGKVSYGAYVFHWPVMALLAKAWIPKRHLPYLANQVAWWVVSFGLTFLVAGASYRWFESRFLRLKTRYPTRPRTP
jgi:peptidoglycan/LPS O-acetylase OafA/YrhL